MLAHPKAIDLINLDGGSVFTDEKIFYDLAIIENPPDIPQLTLGISILEKKLRRT